MEQKTVPQEITSLVGREVYTSTGVFLGEVEDMRLDLDTQEVTGLALHGLNREMFADELTTSRGVIVPYRWVQAVGDIIIVSDIVERIQEQNEEGETVA